MKLQRRTFVHSGFAPPMAGLSAGSAFGAVAGDAGQTAPGVYAGPPPVQAWHEIPGAPPHGLS